MPTGRPSLYTSDLAVTICDRLMEGESLRAICRDPAMPARRTVRSWIRDNYEGFGVLYARACEVRAHEMFDEMLEIADDGSNDTYQTDEGEKVDLDHIQRSRLRVDTRKWALSKMLPKIYGDKVQHTGADGAGPVAFVMYGTKEAASTDEWLTAVAADRPGLERV